MPAPSRSAEFTKYAANAMLATRISFTHTGQSHGTRRGIFEGPLGVEQALQAVDNWLNHPAAVIVNPGLRHQGLLSRLLLAAGTAGNLTTDAHLAAIAIGHNAVFASFDRDFERFAGLRFELLQA